MMDLPPAAEAYLRAVAEGWTPDRQARAEWWARAYYGHADAGLASPTVASDAHRAGGLPRRGLAEDEP